MQQIVGQAIILLGLMITGFGVYTVLRLDGFYARVVVTSKVEAMGFVTVVIGAMVLSGLSAATVKLAIILLFELLTVSVSAHAIARSAWVSGYRVRTVTGTPVGDDGG
ncbi:MAG: cation:proton antiporter [Spirochaetaceae bacterium]|nr:MAG: cation:proton antiporter [Spirochaetaceae bacterium]